MELTLESLQTDRQAFLAAGYKIPEFDYETVHANTVSRPLWIHFGAGNIFRAFQANVAQTLLNNGTMDTGLITAEGFDYEIIEKGYRPHDNLSILVTLKSDNTIEKTIVGSIQESFILDSKNSSEYQRLREIFANPSLQLASFTITEKGYALSDANGILFPMVETDFATGPAAPGSYLGKVVSLLYTRYINGALPIAMVSMDNCSHNGDRLYAAVEAFAETWVKNGLVDKGFLHYIKDSSKVTFPWSMIDKITPRPDQRVEVLLSMDNISNLDPVITSRNTYIAPFVNAEECEYLVIEDAFPNGRPALEKAGVLFTDRTTVEKAEKMKVGTCLNPLHTALAIFGCLLGYTLISEEMKNPLLKTMVERIGYQEGLPVVEDPGILDPERFLDEVLTTRIPNPFLPDSPQRIATDTSQKLSIRFGETIKAYEADSHLDPGHLKMIPLVYAGWLRYLMGIDDDGKKYAPSSDPLLEQVRQFVAGYQLSTETKDLTKLDALLSNDKIFGVNLRSIGMDELVKQYFSELSSGIGAVKKTLEKYVL